MLTAKQNEFIQVFQTAKYRYLMFGGGVSGGKTITSMGILHTLCIEYAGVRFGVFRKAFSTLKRTAMPSLKKVAKLDNTDDLVEINSGVAHYYNGSEILFLDADTSKEPDLDKLKGLELTGAVLEEANEMDEAVFNILKTRIGRWNDIEIDGEIVHIPQFMILTCNPTDNWVKEQFWQPWSEKNLKAPYYFLESLPTDNPFNSQEYLDSLKDLPPEEYERYALGNWNFSSDPNQLISFQWYNNCKVDKVEIDVRQRKVLAIDPARSGDDKTVFAFLSGLKVYKYKELSKVDTTEVGLLAISEMQSEGISPGDCVVDIVGIGAGVYDTMRSRRYRPVGFSGGEKATSSPDFFKFLNKRAEAYWMTREAIRLGQAEIIHHPRAQKELTSIRYMSDEKTIRMESKDDLKKRLGCSPDYGDAISMGIWLQKSSFASEPTIVVL